MPDCKEQARSRSLGQGSSWSGWVSAGQCWVLIQKLCVNDTEESWSIRGTGTAFPLFQEVWKPAQESVPDCFVLHRQDLQKPIGKAEGKPNGRRGVHRRGRNWHGALRQKRSHLLQPCWKEHFPSGLQLSFRACCVPHGPINTAYLPLLAIHPPATSARLRGLSDVLPTRAA